VMFIAKHVKVFYRTGTQPSLLTRHVGDRHLRIAMQEPACNLQPTGVAATSERGYLMGRKILSSPCRWHSLLAKVPGGLGKFSTL